MTDGRIDTRHKPMRNAMAGGTKPETHRERRPSTWSKSTGYAKQEITPTKRNYIVGDRPLIIRASTLTKFYFEQVIYAMGSLRSL